MTDRRAAGFVLACREGGLRYLLLRSAVHKTWSFPKGHLHPGETTRQAAHRETLEETGITDLEVQDGFERASTYRFTETDGRTVSKETTLFLALTNQPRHVQSNEHSDSAWLCFEEALALLEHDFLRETLTAAHRRLTGA